MHISFCFLHYIINPCVALWTRRLWQSLSHSLCLRSADDVTIDCAIHYKTRHFTDLGLRIKRCFASRLQWQRWLIAHARCGCNLKLVFFYLIWRIDICSIYDNISTRWMSQDFIDHLSTLVQVMACCHQATGHFLSQCWPSSISPHGVTRLQWANEPKVENYCVWSMVLTELTPADKIIH